MKPSVTEINSPGHWKETLIVVLTCSLLLVLLTWPAFQSYFFAENFQYLGQYRAHDSKFWQAVFSPTDNIFFRPVFFISGLPWFKLLRTNPLDFHLRNFIFSVVNILLLYRVLLRLVKSRRARILAVLLFALSKVHLTTIGYINIFDSIVMLMLLLLTILFFLRFIAQRNLPDYLLGMVFCTLSVFSKDYGLVSVVIVLALVLTYDLGAGAWPQKVVGWAVRLSPLGVVILIYLSLRYSLIGTIAGPPSFNPIYSPQFSFKIAFLKTLILTTGVGNLSIAPSGATGAAGLGSWLTIKSDRMGAWFSTPQYGSVQMICLGDALLYLGLISLLGFTIFQARDRARKFLFPVAWIIVYFAPTLLTRNFQMYYNYEPLAGMAVLLGICLDKSGKALGRIWIAAIFLIGINGALSNYNSQYHWQVAAEAARRAHVPVVERYRGSKVASITFATEQRDFWAFTLGGYPMLAELLGQPGLKVNYISHDEIPARISTLGAGNLLFDIDNGFLEYPRQLQPLSPASGTERVNKASREINALIANVKRWKEKGHSYQELNRQRALDDGLFPGEMIDPNRLPKNAWGGAVDIAPAPANMGDTFLIVFSGIPHEECVRLSFPINNNYKVYAGTFIETSVPASEEQARSLCLTGNMWFVAR